MFSDKIRYGQDPKDIHRPADATFSAPLKWQREVEKGKRAADARMVFTCSWSDWFIEEADAWRDDGWEVIRRCPDLIFQILTKRAHRMADHLPAFWGEIRDRCWLGISAEDQKNYDRRRPFVDADLSPVMWWSLEPLLGPIDMRIGEYRHRPAWTVVGGESGKGARPCDVAWVRSVVHQCETAGISYFVKQLGANLRHYDERCWRCGHADWGCFDHRPGDEPPYKNCNVCGANSTRCRDAKGGSPEEWPEDLRIRNFPTPRAEVTS